MLLQNHHGLLSQPSWQRSKVKCVHCNPSRAFFPELGWEEGGWEKANAPHSPSCPRQTVPAGQDRSWRKEMEGLDIVWERDRSGFQGARQDRERETCLHLSSCDLFLTLRLLVDCGFKGLERVNHNHTVCGTLWVNQSRIETFSHFLKKNIKQK